MRDLLSNGSVVIDLIGGSATNRSPVENIIECTYMTQPYFKEDEFFSQHFGMAHDGIHA